MQTIAKWLMAGAVSYAILQSGLFYTFLSPDNFTLEQNQYPEAAAVEDEKEVASDSRIKPHHGINNKSGKQIANCATYMLPPRSPEELAATMESWRKATDFVLQHRLTFLNEAGLAFHRDKIVRCVGLVAILPRGSRQATRMSCFWYLICLHSSCNYF